MFLNLLSILFPVAVSFVATGLCFNSYYSENAIFTLVLYTISALLTLLVVLPAKMGYRPILSFSGTLLVVNCAYNFIVSVAVTLAAFIIVWFIPLKKAKKRILFTPDNALVTIRYKKPSKIKNALRHFSAAVFITSLLIFALTFTLSVTNIIWGIRAFPISLEEKVLLSNSAVPSGLVTCSVGYDTAAIYVDTFSDIETENGTTPSPAKAAGMKEGDVIVTINGQRAKTSDFITKGPTGEESLFEVVRLKEDGSTETVFLKITPVYSVPDDRYLIGILYYDSILPGLYQTLQTVSFFYPDNGYFAATAHSSETENASYYTNILKKAVVTGRDETGLTASVGETLGEIAISNRYGSFGYWKNQRGEALPIGKKSDVRLGRATLLSSFEGNEVKEYEAFVTGTYRIDNRDVICLVVDDERIQKAGGVTRGMSGSPIIQNGKIVGALSNTDSKGYCAYATFAYDMAHEIYLLKDSITDKKEMAQ